MFAVLLAVLLIAFCWFFGHLSLLSTSLLILTDSVAHAFRWIGVTDPGVAWLLLGIVAGGIVGAFVGLRRAGRAASSRQVRNVAIAVGGAMLVAGSYPPTRVATAAERPARPRAVAAGGNAAPGRVRTPRARVADVPGGAEPAAPEQPAYAAGGEVQLAPAAASIGVSRAPHAAQPDSDVQVPNEGQAPPAAAPPAAAPPAAASPVRPGGGDAPAEVGDRAVIADVQARLAEARTGASTGDYPAALRALAAADESVALGTTKYGDAAWIASLRRDAAGARTTVRTSCQSAAAAAVRRGDPAPRCE